MKQTDPNGKAAQKAGTKLDSKKPRVGLVLGDFSTALMEIAKVGTMGAQKYSDSNWLQVQNGIPRYTDAMLRHWLQHNAENKYDEESNLLHLAHCCWNALAVLELTLIHNKEIKNEPKKLYK